MAINSLSSASRGMAGLASGINTEEVVQKLLAGTQSKIDKASQKKATLLNKQSMYREVATKLKAMQTGFMSFTSKTNLLSSSFYNNMNATLRAPGNTSPAFSVTATSNAQAGNHKITSISQLASAYTLKTNGTASSPVSGSISPAVAENLIHKTQGGDVPADATLTVMVGDVGVSFQNAPELFGGKSTKEIVDILNTKLGNVGAKASFTNNKLTIISDDPEKFITVRGNISVDSKDNSLSMKMFGGATSLSGKGTFSASIDSDLYLPSITVNLDGRKQDIRLDLGALRQLAGLDADGNSIPSDGGAALMTSLQNSLRQAFGTGVSVSMNNGAVSFSTGSSSKLTLTGDSTTMAVLGLKPGISNKLNSSMSLQDLNFNTGLQGSRHSFTINGVDFSYYSNTSLSTIINDINASKAGVKISYLEAEDRFVIQRSEMGLTDSTSGPVIDMEQTEGNLLSVLFGVKGGSEFSGMAITQVMTGSDNVDESHYKNGGNYTFNINGRDYTFNVPKKNSDEGYTPEEFAEALNKSFRSSFGTMADGTQSVVFSYENGQFSVTANDKNLTVKSSATNPISNPYNLGFASDASTQVTEGSTLLADAGIDFGTTGSISIKVGPGAGDVVSLTAAELSGKTLDEVAALMQQKIRDSVPAGAPQPNLSNVAVTFDKNTAGFRIAGVDIPMEITVNAGDGDGVDKLFGKNQLSLAADAVAGFTTETHGTNSVAWIDGMRIERSSNTFEYSGMTISLHSLYNKDDGASGEATEIVVSRDTETIMEGLKEYLKFYNETIDYLNGLFKADPTYKDYPPLTAEQKKSMSENEIKSWEEKSKEGLLRNDSNLGRILDSLRSSMYVRPEGSSIAIYDLGIDTSFYSQDGHFDLRNESDLKAMLEKDPDAIMRLFAGSGGIMEKVNAAINEATNASIGSPGYITREAGANSMDTTSNIYKQIKDIDNQMTTLEKRYWKEYDRYWKQFSMMEKAIQQMNQQSSWLSSNMNTGG